MQSRLGLDLQKSWSSLEKVLVSAVEVLTATLTLLNTESCVQKLFYHHHCSESTLTLRWQPSHLFLRVSGDAGPLVFLNTVGPEVGQVLRAVPTPKQIHGLCREKFHKKKLALNSKPHLTPTDHHHHLCIPYPHFFA